MALGVMRPQSQDAAFKSIALSIKPQTGGGLIPGAFFVATTGNDTTGDGSIGNPWATIGKFHTAQANPGDTCYMRGGTYTFATRNVLTKDGTNGSPIRLFAYPGETPLLDGINMTLQAGLENDYSLVLDNASWWYIKGISVTRSPSGGILFFNTSSNNILEQCVAYENGRLDTGDGTGIRVYSTSANNLVLNCDSHHNRDQSSDGGNADGFSGSSTGTGNVWRGCRAWFNSDDGFDFFNLVGTPGAALVDTCWVWRSGYDDALNPLGNGNGMKQGGGGTTGGHTFRNCLVFKCRGHGFVDNGNTIACTLLNNTAYDNAGDNYLELIFSGHVLKNNIDYVNGQGRDLNAGTTEVTNSWNTPPGATLTNADFQNVSDFSAMSGARQADGSLPVVDFLKLAGGSDLIDAGTDVGLPFNGSAPDLGAYET